MAHQQTIELIEKQFYITSSGLIDSLDKHLLVGLRDGRKIIGILRSYDQFANLVLQDTIERIYVGDAYADIPHGIFIVRGENVVLLGEIDLSKEDDLPLKQLPVEEILKLQKEEAERKMTRERLKNKVLKQQGWSVDFVQTDFY